MAEMLNRALALHREGRLGEARALYEALLQADARHFDALKLLGTVALQQGDHQEAVRLITRALEVNAGDASAFNNRAVAFRELGQLDAALADCDRAIALEPRHADAHINRGVALKLMGRPHEAVASYQCAIGLAPGNADAHNNCSVVLCELGEPQAALAHADAALQGRPQFAEAWFNRGHALQLLGELEAARFCYEQAARLKPAYAQAFVNLGVVAHDLGRVAEAEAALRHAIALQPRNADALWNLSLVLLLQGHLAEGWPLYEWRRAPAATGARPWRGGVPLAGKTILLHAEQGFGDVIQFSRYVPLVAALGARVVLGVPAALEGVLRSLGGVAGFYTGGPPPAGLDFECPLMSLPLVFGTTLQSIPAAPLYLHAPPDKLVHWAERLGPRVRPRIGIAWSGRSTHRGDRLRSLPLATLLDALPPQFDYVSLQNEVREADRAALARVAHFGAEIADFGDTAALCELVDRVVSVDTSVAHLAAALGRSTWVMLPFVPDWRWLTEREDSPWYPSMRLWRQDATREWGPVLRRLAAALQAA